MERTIRLLALLSVAAMIAAACGGDDSETEAADDTTAETTDTTEDGAEPTTETTDDTDTTEAPSEDGTAGDFPVTIESAGGTWTLESAPQRIVSLSPMATEMLFAIGAGDQVIAVDSFSTYPAEAPVTDLSGFDPNVESVVAFDPDLVVVAFDANELVAGLTALDIPVLFHATPFDIEGGYDVMAELGVVTGRVDETAEAIASLRTEIDAALAAGPDATVRIYHELDESFYSASSFGFVGDVYAQLGATNIADEADTDGFGFPQLTEEYIIAADPELIVITDQVAYTADDVAARPGWGEVSAVKSGNIVTVEADVASRWGPRLPQFITAVAEALATVPAGS